MGSGLGVGDCKVGVVRVVGVAGIPPGVAWRVEPGPLCVCYVQSASSHTRLCFTLHCLSLHLFYLPSGIMFILSEDEAPAKRPYWKPHPSDHFHMVSTVYNTHTHTRA